MAKESFCVVVETKESFFVAFGGETVHCVLAEGNESFVSSKLTLAKLMLLKLMAVSPAFLESQWPLV